MSGYLPSFIVIATHLPEQRRHPQACDELNLQEELEAGCFLTGHPKVKEPVGSATLGFSQERIYLFGSSASPLGSVSYQSIVSISVEDHETVRARFTEARLMLLGNRLLAFRAKITAEGSYVVVEWENEGGAGQSVLPHDGIFCFEGLAADIRARRIHDAALHHAAHYRRVTGASLHPKFARQIDEFELRRCEHCNKVHRTPAPGPAKVAA